ncbi:MAG TPA: lipocalin family protein [Candidatus Acidoferrales bacterium]|jgi:apolipoprotein D and lipocalin family protein|nr:lipocalin family protein [Candidatus Acidoferrales bacterium]
MRIRQILLLGGLIGVNAGMLMAASESRLETVQHVDLNRYAGRWYEIARYPNKFETKCARDVTAEYAPKENGDIRVVNSCTAQDGRAVRSVGTAKVADTSTNAKLKVAFFWPFYGKYWVLDVGDKYDYAVVGEPGRDYLWILSRTPAMPDAVYEKILNRLPARGYDPEKLVRTHQSGASKTLTAGAGTSVGK